MNNNTHHIDNIYKSRFENFEPEVPDKLWNNIREDLISKKKKKIVVFIRYGIAASVAVLLTLGAIFLTDNDNNVPLAENNQRTQQVISGEHNSDQSDRSNAIVQNENDLKPDNTDKQNILENSDTQSTKPEHISVDNIKRAQYANAENNKADKINRNKKDVNVSVQSEQMNIKSVNSSNFKVAQNSITEDNKVDSNEKAIATNDNIVNVEAHEIQIEGASKNNTIVPLVDSSLSEIDIVEDTYHKSKHVAVNESNNNDTHAKDRNLTAIDSIFSADLTDQQLIAQNEIAYTDFSEKTVWAVGGQFSPVYTLNQEFVYGSEYSKDAAPVYENTDYMNNASQPEPKAEMSYSGGVMVKMQKGGRFSIRTGIYYSNKKQTVADVPVLNTVQANSSDYSSAYKAEIENVHVHFQGNSNRTLDSHRDGIYTDYSTVVENTLRGAKYTQESLDSKETPLASDAIENPMQLQINLKQEVEYIEIPLILEYKLIDQRMDLHVHGGINTGFLVVNSAQMEIDNNDFWQGKTDDMNKVIYSASFGFGLGYDVSKRVSLNFEPTLKYGLSNINKDKTVFDHPYSLGFFTGVSYNF